MMRRRILPLTKSIRRDIRIVTHFAWCPERHMAYALSYCGARYELAIYVAPCMNERKVSDTTITRWCVARSSAQSRCTHEPSFSSHGAYQGK
jgi:hypothetical protein